MITADGSLRMEALTTLGSLRALDQLPIVQDLITDDWPALRAAAIRAAVAIDPDNFTLILSGLGCGAERRSRHGRLERQRRVSGILEGVPGKEAGWWAYGRRKTTPSATLSRPAPPLQGGEGLRFPLSGERFTFPLLS